MGGAWHIIPGRGARLGCFCSSTDQLVSLPKVAPEVTDPGYTVILQKGPKLGMPRDQELVGSETYPEELPPEELVTGQGHLPGQDPNLG